MDPKQATQVAERIALSKRLQSIMVHPEWQMIVDLIDDERKFHSNKAQDPKLRQDPSEYANIVRAMDNADAIKSILTKFDTIIRLGKEAQEKLDATQGIVTEHPEAT